ncbi:hypothetical protein BJP36_39045 [Moorena producens JHB]|uniref:Uncharacterized protein n=1 Tax=Moorena producens (strain JHB) TaxID=1454205 RepID=A0A9Q9SUV0_MOOP1|nr:hypothetical protein [Moorena producens]WAN70063.1 hypothetical protein BJP36_39045 [Moorena producens JHB]
MGAWRRCTIDLALWKLRERSCSLGCLEPLRDDMQVTLRDRIHQPYPKLFLLFPIPNSEF